MMIINNKVMCVPQQTSQLALLDKIAPMAPLATMDDETVTTSAVVDIKQQSSEIVDENDDQETVVHAPINATAIATATAIDNDDLESAETETKTSPPQEPLYPETSIPISPSRNKKSSKRKNKSKKSVRFDQAVTARPCLHRKDYTSHEAAASWYGRREFESIRRELLKTLSLIYAGKFVECDESPDNDDSELFDSSSSSLATASTSGSLQPQHQQKEQPQQQQRNSPQYYVASSRGLEGFTVKGSLRSSVRKLRQKAITEVLVEQDFQVDRAESMKLTYLYYDDETLRHVYHKHAKVASEIARQRGFEDHLVAIGAAPAMTPVTTKRRTGLRKLFFKSSPEKQQQKQQQRRRWSEQPQTMTEAAAMASSSSTTTNSRKPQRRSWTLDKKNKSEKKLGKKQLWSLLTPKSTKPNNPTAMVA